MILGRGSYICYSIKGRYNGYPPNKEPKAVGDVLEQAKLQAYNM